LFGCIALQPRDRVAVGVERDGHGAMPEPALRVQMEMSLVARPGVFTTRHGRLTPVTFQNVHGVLALELHPIKNVDVFAAYRSLVVARGGTDTFDSDVINPASLIRIRKPGFMVTDSEGNGLGVAEPCQHLVGVGVTGQVENRDIEHVRPRQLVSEQSNLHLFYASYGHEEAADSGGWPAVPIRRRVPGRVTPVTLAIHDPPRSGRHRTSTPL
jgi:hypothetical protein